MKVKICGITNVEDALISENYGAHALGFIFYDKSKRYISPGNVKEIINLLSPFTLKVGVFVNETSENVNRLAEDIGLSAVQLHGEETPDYIKNIKYPVIKSLRVSDGFDYSIIKNYYGVSFLLDAYVPGKEYGGTGTSFNWNQIPPELKSRIILAGGISIHNIEEIINNIKPAAIDISSSIESEPGKKDEQKIKLLFNKINSLRS